MPVFLGALILLFASLGQASAQKTEWGDSIQAQLDLSGDNASELLLALKEVPDAQRDELAFLIENMPAKDLKSRSAQFLLDDVAEATRIRELAKWKIPDDVFNNYVLPYANVDEEREFWRAKLHAICQPIVVDCDSISDAVQKLNRELFATVKVKYSTRRKKANQAPSESMESGLASCTGLSILLVDGCRSVGIPARLAGIPSWPNKRGNHTWVEIWDNGRWHFTGACEPSDKGLDHTWFQGDAALAVKSSRLNAIYAVSFKKTDTPFPMVWSRGSRNTIFATNVTDRYTASGESAKDPSTVSTFIRIWNKDRTKRLLSNVVATNTKDPEDQHQGVSRAGTADMNDMLTFELRKGSSYQVKVYRKDQLLLEQTIQIEADTDPQQFELVIGNNDSKTETMASVRAEIEQFFNANLLDAAKPFSAKAQKVYRQNPQAVRKMAWDIFRRSALANLSRKDFDQNQVTFEKHLSPYTIKEVGERPENGWPLFIAMHGGGGAPARVNDSQWRIMQRYYKDQSQVKGYKYLALRAPNNTWNGFYDDYVYPLIENLIRQFVCFGDVDPNKVFIMGYSHGGYGAFAIGPKIPYRFAAIHSSAAAPTDGQTSAQTLRNTRFTFMVGERDNAYGRRERCEKFAKQIEKLKGNRNDIYPVDFLYKEGYGHGGLPDRDMIAKMYPFTRNATPSHLTWEMTDSVVDRFFWLSVENPSRGKTIDAKIRANRITIKTKDVTQLSLRLDNRLIDTSKPIEVEAFGKTFDFKYQPSLATLCQTLAESGDINLAFDFVAELNDN